MTDNTTSMRASRRWLYIAWLVAGIMFAAYFSLWRYASGYLEATVEQWVADQRAAGLEVEHGTIHRTGFPFFLRVHIDNPEIGSPGAWNWNAERLTIDALPYDLTRVIFSPSGKQEFTSPATGAWRFQGESIRASIGADDARGWVFSMNISGAEAATDRGASLKLDSMIYDVAPDADDPAAITLSVVGNGLEIEQPEEIVDVSQFQTALTLEEAALLSELGPDSWANAGGELLIHGLTAVVNGAEFAIKGAVSLDDDAYPQGKLDAELAKPAGLAPILRASGLLSNEEVDAAVAGLGLAAIASGGVIKSPIALEHGEAFISGVKIADLEPFSAN